MRFFEHARAWALAIPLAACASDPAPTPAVPVAAPPPPEATAAPPSPSIPDVAETAPPPAPPTPPPHRTRTKATDFHLRGGALELPGPVVFESGSDKLSPVSDEVLEVVHDYLDAKPDVTLLRIEGHTDSDGRAAANATLSEKRALSVARWLVAVGVKCDRLIPVGFGQTKPIAPNDTPDNKAQNRRITFVNAALRGHAIGGAPVDGGGRVAGDPCR